MDIAEYWLDELPAQAGSSFLCCPRCHGAQWSVTPNPYGIELACWRCPTYVGVVIGQQSLLEYAGRADRKRELAWRQWLRRWPRWLLP